MAIKRSIIPEVGLQDSYEIVHRHLPVDQPPSSFTYIVSKLDGGYVVKNGKTGVIEAIEWDLNQANQVIQKAIDALPPEGGRILLTEGIYIVSATLNLPSNSALVGQGRGTVLKLADNAEVDIIRNKTTDITKSPDSFIEIRDLALDGNQDNQPVDGAGKWRHPYSPTENWLANIRLKNVEHFTLENIYTHHATGYGIEVKAAKYGLIKNIQVHDNGDDGISVTNAGLAAGYYSKYITLENIWAWDNRDDRGNTGGSGTGVEIDDGCQSITLNNIHAWGVTADKQRIGVGVHVHPDFASYPVTDITINNIIAYNNEWCNLWLSDASRVMVNNIVAEKTNKGLDTHRTAGADILVEAYETNIRDITLSNIVCRGAYQPGIKVGAASGKEVLDLKLRGITSYDNDVENVTEYDKAWICLDYDNGADGTMKGVKLADIFIEDTRSPKQQR